MNTLLYIVPFPVYSYYGNGFVAWDTMPIYAKILSIIAGMLLFICLSVLLTTLVPTLYDSWFYIKDDYKNMLADINERWKRKHEHRLAREQLKKDKERKDAFERLVQLAMSQRDEWKDRTLTLEELRDGDLICIKYGGIDEIFKVIYIRRFECNLVDTVYFKGLYLGTEGFWLSSKTNSQDPRQHVDSYMIIKTR
jgi:hypothetical protein